MAQEIGTVIGVEIEYRALGEGKAEVVVQVRGTAGTSEGIWPCYVNVLDVRVRQGVVATGGGTPETAQFLVTQ